MPNNPAEVPAVTLGDELTVSAIGFGAMALTPVYGEVDDTESLATLHHCLDVGVTFIDTANIYGGGNNERLISKLLAAKSPLPPSSASKETPSTAPRGHRLPEATPPTCTNAWTRACRG